MAGSTLDNYAAKGQMRTASRWVALLDPNADDILLEDIVEAASRIIRFSGHSTITLLEHSLRVCYLAIENGATVREARTALMHDAHEVYVSDLSSPLKQAMRLSEGGGPSTYDNLEQSFMAVMAEKFDLTFPHPQIIHDADMEALGQEADHTWGEGTAEEWGRPAPSPILTFTDAVSSFYLVWELLGDPLLDGQDAPALEFIRESA